MWDSAKTLFWIPLCGGFCVRFHNNTRDSATDSARRFRQDLVMLCAITTKKILQIARIPPCEIPQNLLCEIPRKRHIYRGFLATTISEPPKRFGVRFRIIARFSRIRILVRSAFMSGFTGATLSPLGICPIVAGFSNFRKNKSGVMVALKYCILRISKSPSNALIVRLVYRLLCPRFISCALHSQR